MALPIRLIMSPLSKIFGLESNNLKNRLAILVGVVVVPDDLGLAVRLMVTMTVARGHQIPGLETKPAHDRFEATALVAVNQRPTVVAHAQAKAWTRVVVGRTFGFPAGAGGLRIAASLPERV